MSVWEVGLLLIVLMLAGAVLFVLGLGLVYVVVTVGQSILWWAQARFNRVVHRREIAATRAAQAARLAALAAEREALGLPPDTPLEDLWAWQEHRERRGQDPTEGVRGAG